MLRYPVSVVHPAMLRLREIAPVILLKLIISPSDRLGGGRGRARPVLQPYGVAGGGRARLGSGGEGQRIHFDRPLSRR